MTARENAIIPFAPTITTDPWTTCMRKGRFEAAWKLADQSLQCRAGKPCWHLPRHHQYIWDGTSLQDKIVLVRCYHGLGDTIQYIRFIPQLRKICRKLIVWASEKLLPLFNSLACIDELMPLHDGAPGIAYDVDIEIMELGHVFRINAETIPKEIPYLTIPPMRIGSYKRPLIGLVWKAGEWDERRSMPYSFIRRLAAVRGVQFVIAQPGAIAAGWQEDFGMWFGEFDLYDYARQLKALDLLITIDSMPAHLAGALGIPVWTLLPAEADWRWMQDRADTPWYPTMRLFRQTNPGDWGPVIEEVKSEFQSLT